MLEERKQNYIKCLFKIKAEKEQKTKTEAEKKGKKQKTETNMLHTNPTILITTLNTNGLSAPIKRYGLSEH